MLRREWSILRLEALYELAYLRSFAAWEMYQEAVFLRSVCGYASAAGQETPVSGTYFPSLAAAEAAVLAGNTYMLWHSPQKVINRCKKFIGPGPQLQELTIASNFARLDSFAATRHRIVHEQLDAKRKFDAATLLFAGRTYPSSRPGKFLRDWDISQNPPQRWLGVAINELTSLLTQMI